LFVSQPEFVAQSNGHIQQGIANLDMKCVIYDGTTVTRKEIYL